MEMIAGDVCIKQTDTAIAACRGGEVLFEGDTFDACIQYLLRESIIASPATMQIVFNKKEESGFVDER